MRSGFRALVVVLLLCCFLIQIPAQSNTRSAEPNGSKAAVSEMRSAIERYTVDRGSLARSYSVAVSRGRRERFKKFYTEMLRAAITNQKLTRDFVTSWRFYGNP